MSALKEIVETHYRGLNEGDLDLAISVFDENVETITPGGPPMQTLEEFWAFAAAFLNAVPDARLRAERVIETDQTIVVEGKFSGTQTRDLVGHGLTIPATGRSFEFSYADIFDVRDGKVVKHHIYWDNASFMAQLGLMHG